MTLLISHPASHAHATPPGHPERIDRMKAVDQALSPEAFPDLERLEARGAADEELLRAHPAGYIDAIRAAAPASGLVSLDPDTHMSPGSLEAATRAAGAVCQSVDLVLEGRARTAFAAVRPPGHHAEKTRAMGFCLLSSAAIGALHALRHHGLERVAVVDFDVHHGNGTQDVLWDERGALFISTHQSPLYPGTGAAHERGAHDNIVNIPLASGTDGAGFRRAMLDHALPALRAHRPELVIVSAGFDAHVRDPLASLAFEAEDFAWAAGAICDAAEESAEGRVVSTLEGGYDLTGLAQSTAAYVAVLEERDG